MRKRGGAELRSADFASIVIFVEFLVLSTVSLGHQLTDHQ